MLIDTGAGLTVMDSSLQHSIVPQVEERRVTMLGGTRKIMKCYQGPPLKMGAIFDKQPKVLVADFEMMARHIGNRFKGIIAIDIMKRGKVLLDYDDRVFKIHVGPWSLDSPGIKEVELNEKSDIPEFSAEIAGHSISFGIDTGSDDCLHLESAVFEALVDEGIIGTSKIKTQTVTGGGMHSANNGWFLKGELMGKKLEGMAVSSDPRVSNVCLGWLYEFNIEIDFNNRKFRYHLRDNVTPPCNIQLMNGAILLFGDQGAMVQSLRPGGGATGDAGIKPGDIITEFASLKGTEMNATTIAEAVTDKAGQNISIRYLRNLDGMEISAKLQLPAIISDWNFGGMNILQQK
jgi:hypothetical protein